MSLDSLFHLAGQAALLLWAALAIAPRNRTLTDVVVPILAPAALGCAYVGLMAVAAPSIQGGFGSLDAVRLLFEDPRVLLAGWIHYLAFDLFVGAWEARDARDLGISRWLLLPCLASTFLAGPLGLLLYLALRGATRRRLSTETPRD